MGACFKQYSNHNLYLYPERRTVCYYNDTHHYGKSTSDPNLYSGSADLFRYDFNSLANHFQ